MTPPPPFDGAGTLSALASELGEHIAAEARGTWVCDAHDLEITRSGRLEVVGGRVFQLEPEGLRALLGHFAGSFPRAFGVLSKVSGSTLAAVWADCFAPEPGERVKLHHRVAPGEKLHPSAVWGVSPSTYATYGVDAFLRDLANELPTQAGAVFYTTSGEGACEASVLNIHLPGDIHILYDEAYKGRGAVVRQRGEPVVLGARTRRRADGKGEAGTTCGASVVTRVRFALEGA